LSTFFKRFLNIRHIGDSQYQSHTIAFIEQDNQGQNWLVIPCLRSGFHGCKGHQTEPTRLPVPANVLKDWLRGGYAKFEIAAPKQEGKAA